ncbi:MAG: hypothetical protein LBQ84_02790 [Flavobacteriaceae bacterium]|jgi:alpha-tubulin suppressor-like RCC1 family protein|nr:hypothetical protein [Flavobacteriaceae bacterium]
MKKINILSTFVLFFITSVIFSQVGIGNKNPRGVLDVNDENGENTQGIVLPVVPDANRDTIIINNDTITVATVVKPGDAFDVHTYINEEENNVSVVVPAPTAGAEIGTIVFDVKANCIRLKHTEDVTDEFSKCLVDSRKVRDEIFNYSIYDAGEFKLKKVAAGIEFSVAIGMDDYLYTAGFNASARTGKGYYDNSGITWGRIYNSEKIVDVAAGSYHGFAITESGKLLGWGENNSRRIGRPIDSPGNIGYVYKPTQVIVDNASGVKKVVAANEHSILLTKDGQVYATGIHTDYRTGLGDIITIAYPNITDSFTQLVFEGLTPEATIVDIAISYYNGAAIDSEGNLWTWGRNDYYITGLGIDSDYTKVPTKISMSPGVIFKKVALAQRAGIALTDDNKLYQWGDKRIIAGNDPPDYITTPTLVDDSVFPFEEGEEIVLIEADWYHEAPSSMLVTNLNKVYAAGYNEAMTTNPLVPDSRRLGIDTDTNNYTGAYKEIHTLGIYPGTQFTKISMSATHTVLSTKENSDASLNATDFRAYGTGNANRLQLGTRSNPGSDTDPSFSVFFEPVKR